MQVAHFFLVSVSAVPGAKCWNTSACFSRNCSRLLALPLCRRQRWQLVLCFPDERARE